MLNIKRIYLTLFLLSCTFCASATFMKIPVAILRFSISQNKLLPKFYPKFIKKRYPFYKLKYEQRRLSSEFEKDKKRPFVFYYPGFLHLLLKRLLAYS